MNSIYSVHHIPCSLSSQQRFWGTCETCSISTFIVNLFIRFYTLCSPLYEYMKHTALLLTLLLQNDWKPEKVCKAHMKQCIASKETYFEGNNECI